MTRDELVTLIATKFAEGLYHPGDGGDQAPTTLKLPFFRTVGMPPEMVRQVEMTTRLIVEGMIHLIENDGNSDIVPRLEDTT